MQLPSTAPLSAFEALRWQMDMGIKECIGETPQFPWPSPTNSIPSRAPEPVIAAPKPAISTVSRAAETISASASTAIANARAAADAATDLSSLELAIRSFNDCPLKRTATNTVFAQGVPESRVMFIGEAPGADEDRQGIPFCGVSGQLLDKMLGCIGLNRTQNFYITNTIYWRPPGNRKPTAEELAICNPFVEKHIALVNPKLLILVGGTATQSVLNDARGITRLRGQVFDYKNQYMDAEVPVHVIYHPSYLLRQPAAKKQTWADLLAIKEALSS